MLEFSIASALSNWNALQWTAMLALAALGGLMHGFVGIGLPLLATPLLALIIGFQNAVIVLVAPSMAVIACTFLTYRGTLALGDSLRRAGDIEPAEARADSRVFPTCSALRHSFKNRLIHQRRAEPHPPTPGG